MPNPRAEESSPMESMESFLQKPLPETISELEAQMADPSLYSDAQKSADVQRAYQKAQQALQTLYEQWEAAEAALSQEEA